MTDEANLFLLLLLLLLLRLVVSSVASSRRIISADGVRGVGPRIPSFPKSVGNANQVYRSQATLGLVPAPFPSPSSLPWPQSWIWVASPLCVISWEKTHFVVATVAATVSQYVLTG